MEKLFDLSVFMGAPTFFEKTEGIINTGGEGLGLMIAAGAAAVAALGGIIFFFVSGSKK